MPVSRRFAVLAAGALAGVLVAAGALVALRDDDAGRDAGAGPRTAPTAGAASGLASGPAAAGPTSSARSSPAASSSAASSPPSGGPGPTAAAAPRSLLPRYPSPSTRLVPPTPVDAAALGCERLPDGWRAEFAVTLDGGRGWTLLPQSGPVTSTDGRVWRVTVETPDAGAAPPTLTLDRILVGGGWPYDTVSVALPAALVRTVSCAQPSGG